MQDDFGIFHVYNRGVEKRDIFSDDMDRFRFVDSLREFNTTGLISIRDIRDQQNRCPTPGNSLVSNTCEKLVNILCYCLMSNHFHLIVEPLGEGNLSLFVKKISGGYTNYFNIRHKRSGHLFQGKYKKREIEDDESLVYLRNL